MQHAGSLLNETVLVTGSGGLLGQAVLQELHNLGASNVLAPRRAELNLQLPAEVAHYLETRRPTIVIHLASLVFGLAGNLKHQLASLETNTAINLNFFSALRQAAPKKVFFAGTVASYPHPYVGDILKEDQFFNGLPHHGEFGYAMAKRHAYAHLSLMHSELQIPFVYGILTNLYGPGDRFDVEGGHVIPSLIVKAHQAASSSSPLEVWGDGTATRDFLHSSDAARAILLALLSEHVGLLNISSGTGLAIGEAAQIISDAAGLPSLQFLSDKPVGIKNRIVDNTLLRNIGFSQQVTPQQGLALTYAWYAANKDKVRT